jgi:hypothetical protein
MELAGLGVLIDMEMESKTRGTQVSLTGFPLLF